VPNIRITLMMLLSTICLSCERELSVADFRDEFGNYRPELKVEGLLQQDKPEDSIIRIIRTDTITNTDVYNGIDDDGDGDIDEYDETLPLIQDTTAIVKVTNLNSGEESEFQYIATANSFVIREDEDSNDREGEDSNDVIPYGGYKPKSNSFQIEIYAQYQIEIYSRAFDKTITGVTTVYPPVEFINIDTLSTFDNDYITLKSDDEKAIFWQSDLNVTSYFITVEVSEQIHEDSPEFEFVDSFSSSRDNDLTEEHKDVSIGKENFQVSQQADAGTVLKITVEALSPEYGRYIFSSLPLNDTQRSNLRDQDGKPVMGAFGATAAKSMHIAFEESR